jgi:hypothetical protein
MIQFQQGAAYSDNQRDMSEAAFEADAVAAVIWNTLRTIPEGFARSRRDQEKINKYPAEITRRPSIVCPRAEEVPAQRSRSVCRSLPDSFLDDRRRVIAKRPAQTPLNFHTIGEA